jgi:hypothetical protein
MPVKSTQLKSLRLIHKALLISQLLFAGVFFSLIYLCEQVPLHPEWDRMLQLIALAIAFVAYVVGGKYIFNKRIIAARQHENIQEKFSLFRSASLIQYTLIEMASIVASFSFFLTGNLAFIIMALVLIFIFAILNPSSLKVSVLLREREEDIKQL